METFEGKKIWRAGEVHNGEIGDVHFSNNIVCDGRDTQHPQENVRTLKR